MSALDYEYLTLTAKFVLGVSADATLGECKRAYLWRLEDEHFSPSPILIEAAGQLGVIPIDASDYPNLQAHFENSVKLELDRFVRTFWSLECEMRKSEWERISASCISISKYRNRLAGLKSALALKLPPETNEKFFPVVDCLKKVFLAPEAIREQQLNLILDEYHLSRNDLVQLSENFARSNAPFNDVLATLQLSRREASEDTISIYDDQRKNVRAFEKSRHAFSQPPKKESFRLVHILIIIFGVSAVSAVIKHFENEKSQKQISLPKPQFPNTTFPPSVLKGKTINPSSSSIDVPQNPPSSNSVNNKKSDQDKIRLAPNFPATKIDKP